MSATTSARRCSPLPVVEPEEVPSLAEAVPVSYFPNRDVHFPPAASKNHAGTFGGYVIKNLA